MNASELGKLVSTDLRNAWAHEAHDFTPWLAENLDRLSDVIGVDLDLEGCEVQVGPYRADIVASDPADGTRVLIENQLEHANLQHLGQVLAYLAGLEAKVVVWIAKEFDEQHRSAIRWLNDHTDDPFAFFAVRVRVVQIGKSPLAPVFDVLERPNGWDRRVHETTRTGELSELGQFRRAFWNHVASKYPGEVKPNRAASWVSHYVKEASLGVTQYVSRNEVGVYLAGKRGEGTNSLRAKAEAHRATIEQELGVTGFGEWCGTSLDVDMRDQGNWDRAAEWLHDQRLAYERVLRRKTA